MRLLPREFIAGEAPDHGRVTVDLQKGELVFEAKAAEKAGRCVSLAPVPSASGIQAPQRNDLRLAGPTPEM